MIEAAPPEDTCQQLRAVLPAVSQFAYFDYAAVAPLSSPARDVLCEWAEEASAFGVVNWSKWRKRIEETRRHAAQLLGSSTDEIAFVANTTDGLNRIAHGYRWQPGDNVVVPSSEFPSNLVPWRTLERRGVEVRIVPTSEERLLVDELKSYCDHHTRLVAVSWVGYSTGWRNDLCSIADVAHRSGALLCVDAIQGLGVLPLDLSEVPIDFLAADGHKWLLGPEGAGILFVRRESLERLDLIGAGWNSVRHAGDFANPVLNWKDHAGRFEGGTYNMAGVAALGASLRLLNEIGVPAICERVMGFTDQVVEKLRSVGALLASARSLESGVDRRSGIVSFSLPGIDPHAVKSHAFGQGVVLNCRSGRLRVSPHAANNQEDLDRLLAAIRTFQSLA